MKKSLELDRFLPYRLNVVAATLSFLFEERVLQSSRVSFPQWRILGVLGSEGPTAQQNFVKRSKMDKISISRAVNGLIEMGAVVSTESTDDRRARILQLTDDGRRLYKELASEALEVDEEVVKLAGLPDAERFLDELERVESAVRTLRRAAKNVNA